MSLLPNTFPVKHPDGTTNVLVSYGTPALELVVYLLLVVLEWLEAIHAKQS